MNKLVLLIIVFLIIQSCHGQRNPSSQAGELNLDSLVNSQISSKKIPSIAIGIVKDDKIVLAKGFGLADVENKIPATRHTIYQIGSVTKMITGHLLAILMDQQKMSISDTLAKLFPSFVEFPKSPTGQEVTIAEIATHSSEFPRYPDNLQRVDPDPIQGYAKEEMFKGIEAVSIDTMIGVRYNYSNFGYGLLGTAMEYSMGRSLSDLMQEYVISKYGMSSTSLIFRDDLNDRLAIPYLEVSPYKRTEPWEMGALSGAGNVFSSVSDLNRFMIEIMSNNEINAIQQKKYLKINETWSYGLGCFIIDSKQRNTQIIYHGGDIDGYASSLTLYPEYKLGFVMLTNWGEGRAIGEAFTIISTEIVNHYLGELEDD